MIITAEQLAKKLNGREYRNEITTAEIVVAKGNNLVVIYGQSDDLIEILGAIEEELGMYDGGTICLNKDGVFKDWDDDDEMKSKSEAELYFARQSLPRIDINCKWDHEGYSWFIQPDDIEGKIKFYTFDIMDDGEKYCRGIVFDISEIK